MDKDTTYIAPTVKTLGTISDVTLANFSKSGNVADGISHITNTIGSEITPVP